MERSFREEWALWQHCFSSSSATMMFTVAITRKYIERCVCWITETEDYSSLDIVSESGAVQCIGRDCWLRSDQAFVPSRAWARYTCCVPEWHICVWHSHTCPYEWEPLSQGGGVLYTGREKWAQCIKGWERLLGKSADLHDIFIWSTGKCKGCQTQFSSWYKAAARDRRSSRLWLVTILISSLMHTRHSDINTQR